MSILAITIIVFALGTLFVVVLNVLGWRRVGERQSTASASVLIPARNEESNLGPCLETVLSQSGVREVLVADDHSTDRTPEIIRAFATRDSRVRVVRPAELPPGWCGKNHACHTLGLQATGEWLLFLDADARLSPGAVPRMIAECEQRDLSFLSCWPQLEMRGFWERLLMPLLNFVLLTLYPAPVAASREDRALGLAHGACILVRPDAYRQLGGHEAVKSELFEDTRLAQHWRARGERSLCLDGTGTVRVRMYDSLASIWGGFRKNLYPAFRRQPAFWAFMLLHAGVFLAPFVLACTVIGGSSSSWLFAVAAGAVLLSRVLLALRFRHPLWSALLHPVGELLLLAIGVASWWQVVSGRGVEWKGRRYGQASKEPA